MIILPDPTIGFFKLFSSFYNRYKPVNRSIHAFATFTKNQEGVRASGYIQKYVAGKYTHAVVHLWHGSTQLEYSSQKMAQQIRE